MDKTYQTDRESEQKPKKGGGGINRPPNRPLLSLTESVSGTAYFKALTINIRTLFSSLTLYMHI